MCYQVVALLLMVMASATGTPNKVCVGCPAEHNADDPEVLRRLSAVLVTVNSDHEVKKVVSVKKQIVAGTKYIVQFQTKSDQLCQITWVEQPWISPDPQFVEINQCKEKATS